MKINPVFCIMTLTDDDDFNSYRDTRMFRLIHGKFKREAELYLKYRVEAGIPPISELDEIRKHIPLSWRISTTIHKHIPLSLRTANHDDVYSNALYIKIRTIVQEWMKSQPREKYQLYFPYINIIVELLSIGTIESIVILSQDEYDRIMLRHQYITIAMIMMKRQKNLVFNSSYPADIPTVKMILRIIHTDYTLCNRHYLLRDFQKHPENEFRFIADEYNNLELIFQFLHSNTRYHVTLADHQKTMACTAFIRASSHKIIPELHDWILRYMADGWM